MLQQILKDMYIHPDLLAELSEEQKNVLFIKMREEQVRRWKEWDVEENETTIKRTKPTNKKGANVHYLLGADGNPWTWVLGESDIGAFENEKEKNFDALDDKEVERKARELAEKEAAELRAKELAAIELRAKKLKEEEEKLEKEHAEKEKLLKTNKSMIKQTNDQTKNKFVIKLNENERFQIKNRRSSKEKESNEKRTRDELKRLKEKQEQMEAAKLKEEKLEKEKLMQETLEKERKEREAEERRQTEKKKLLQQQEQKEQEEKQKEREIKRLEELQRQTREEEERLAELKRLEEEEKHKIAMKERELKELQDKRTRELYLKMKKQKDEERKKEEEARKKDHEAWMERERKAKEAESERRTSVSRARKEVKRREEEVKELQKQGFIEVASGLYRRLSLSKSRVHRIEPRVPAESQTNVQKKGRPTISSPELISATGTTIPVRSIKPPKPERSPPSIPKRNPPLGPAPPPPINNGDVIGQQKRTDRPSSRQQIIEWWQEVEMSKGSGFKDDVPLPWFHGLITRQEAESLLEEEPVGSFLVRVSERVWGYTISYRSLDRCKHFLVDTSDNSYQFFGHNQIAHASLNDLVKFHHSKPLSGIGGELLLKPCGQKEGVDPDYKELVSQTTTI